jgi:glycosyltransferase involved in cell wall biosynthesis
MSRGRFLMLVSARIDAGLREQVRAGRRPRPEYIVLEEVHGLRLLDWSRLGRAGRRRDLRSSLGHALAGLGKLGDHDAVLSDGEHVGVPLALGMRALRRSTPHVMIGHHVTGRVKRLAFRRLRPQRSISRLVLHSARQAELAEKELGLPASLLSLVPYGVDSRFWAPGPAAGQAIVISPGREHRDFLTLAQACGDFDTRVLLTNNSQHSPAARSSRPELWPPNFEVRQLDYIALREAYSQAAVAVVPLLPADFQAGVTTLLEAMAMGKAVVVSGTEGLRGLVEDQVTARTVPPGDVKALREAVASLLSNPLERVRLGANARAAVESRFDLERYAAALQGQLEAVASPGPIAWRSGTAGQRSGLF